jgi:hypothetical protein
MERLLSSAFFFPSLPYILKPKKKALLGIYWTSQGELNEFTPQYKTTIALGENT